MEAAVEGMLAEVAEEFLGGKTISGGVCFGQ